MRQIRHIVFSRCVKFNLLVDFSLEAVKIGQRTRCEWDLTDVLRCLAQILGKQSAVNLDSPKLKSLLSCGVQQVSSFDVIRVALLVKHETSRSKNKHKPLAILEPTDDVCIHVREPDLRNL